MAVTGIYTEGGVRVHAWVSGGFVPAAQRGTTRGADAIDDMQYIHTADW